MNTAAIVVISCTVGWTLGAVYLTPPVQPYEVVVSILGLALGVILLALGGRRK